MATLKFLLPYVLLITGTTLANAQEVGDVHPALTEKFTLHAGVFFPDRNFKIHVDGLGAGPNPDIIDDYSGSLINLGTGINYHAFDKIGIGLSYNRLELDLSITKPDWRVERKRPIRACLFTPAATGKWVIA